MLRPGDGTDVIASFETGSDIILLDGLSFADLTISKSGGISTVSADSEDLAIIWGVGLTAADFIESDPGTNTPTPGNDTLIGTSGNDVIDALAGDDSVDGLAGNRSTSLGVMTMTPSSVGLASIS